MGLTTSTQAFAQALHKISTEVVPQEENATWFKLLDTDIGPGEMGAIVRVQAVRALRRSSPANLAALVYRLATLLHGFVAAGATVAPWGNDHPRVRVALLLLSRIVPVLLEDMPSAADAGVAADSPVHPLSAQIALHLFEESCTFDRDGTRFKPIDETAPDVTLGEHIVRGIVGCASVPGFGCGSRQLTMVPSDRLPNVDAARLWWPGVARGREANDVPIHTDSWTFVNRLRILRALTGVIAGQTYTSSVLVRDPFRARLVSTETPGTATLCASLLGTLMHYNPTGTVPYSSHWVSAAEDCVDHAAQALLLGLDCDDFHPEAARRDTLVISQGVSAAPPRVPPRAAPEGGAGEEEAAGAADGDSAAGAAATTSPAEGDGPAGQQSPTRHRHRSATPDGSDEAAAAALAQDRGDSGDDAAAAAAGDATDDRPDADEAVEQHSRRPPPPQSRPFQPDLNRHAWWGVVHNLSRREGGEVLRGLLRLMGNHVASRNTYLPGSQRLMPGHEFYFALFWLLMERAPNLRYIYCNDKSLVHMSLVPLLDFAFQGTTHPSRQPYFQCVITSLAMVSMNRSFAVMLNEPFNEWIPFDVQAFTGTYADLLLISLHSLILKRSVLTEPSFIMLFSVIANIAPYVTSLCSATATKYVGLLKAISTETWLRAHALNPRLLPKLVVALASLVQYQPTGSSSLVYALLQQREAVANLVAVAHRSAELGLPPKYHEDVHVYALHCAVKAADEELATRLRFEPDVDVLELVKKVTLVGKLPAPHALHTLVFEPSAATDAWRVSWVWSMVFTHNFPHVVDPAAVRIFNLARRA